jgi:hypothetical protein
VRVILENSTVCLDSRWISLHPLFLVGVVFLIDDSGSDVGDCSSVLGFSFLMESLILAQDERWRRA